MIPAFQFVTRAFSLRIFIVIFCAGLCFQLNTPSMFGHLDTLLNTASAKLNADFKIPKAGPESLTYKASSKPESRLIKNTFSSITSTFSRLKIKPWSYWVLKSLIVASTIYLVFCLPLLSIPQGLLLSAFLILSNTLLQLGWQIIQGELFQLALISQVLFIGHFAMLFWLKNNNELLDLQTELHETNIELAQALFKQNELEKCRQALVRCATDEDVLELLYEIAIEQERKRQYHYAIRCYDEILARVKNFQDAKSRRASLSEIENPAQGTLTQTFAATQTAMIAGNALQNPVLGRYEIQKEIGRGAMGVVYLGQDPHIGRNVAIKTLNYAQFEDEQIGELKERFFQEAEAAGRLSHPNIVTVFDIGEEPDLAFIAMDYIEGKALSAHVKKQTLLDTGTVLRLIAEVAEALNYAHENKIIHRDIKPGNLLYDAENGEVKVSDFGIARVADNSRTKTGEVLGSPFYMSPEQLKGLKLTGTTDIYSLGVTFFQLLSGELPFEGESLANLTYEIINKKHRPLAQTGVDLPLSVSRIINKALQKDPSKRYQHAYEMAEAIDKVLEKEYPGELA